MKWAVCHSWYDLFESNIFTYFSLLKFKFPIVYKWNNIFKNIYNIYEIAQWIGKLTNHKKCEKKPTTKLLPYGVTSQTWNVDRCK